MTISIEVTSMDRSSSSTFPTDTPFPMNSSVLCPDWPSVPQTTLIPSLYSIVCLLGTFGNALAVCVLAQGSGGRRTVANTFMLNLCVSDLLFLLSLPLWAVYYSLGYHWPFGRLACKLCGALLHLNLYASIFFITAMSVDRYLAIVYPLRSQRAREPFYAQLTCVLVWVLACACTTPILALRDTHNLPEYEVEACVMIYPHQNWFLGLAWMKMLLGFLLPLAVISSCYCAIARHLLGSPGLGPKSGSQERSVDRPQTSRGKPAGPQEAHSRSETRARSPTPCVNPSHGGGQALEGRGIDSRVVERVLWTVAAVVLAFFLCWFPFHCVTLLQSGLGGRLLGGLGHPQPHLAHPVPGLLQQRYQPRALLLPGEPLPGPPGGPVEEPLCVHEGPQRGACPKEGLVQHQAQLLLQEAQ